MVSYKTRIEHTYLQNFLQVLRTLFVLKRIGLSKGQLTNLGFFYSKMDATLLIFSSCSKVPRMCHPHQWWNTLPAAQDPTQSKFDQRGWSKRNAMVDCTGINQQLDVPSRKFRKFMDAMCQISWMKSTTCITIDYLSKQMLVCIIRTII